MADAAATPEVLPKFCRNCQHVLVGYTRDYTKAECGAPQNRTGYNLVTGEQGVVQASCEQQRNYKTDANLDRCCEDAKWFLQASALYPPKEDLAGKVRIGKQVLDIGM